jgi:Rap1a immunity proteins
MTPSGIKLTVAMCLVLCSSISSAKAFSTTYDLPGPGAGFLYGNDVYSWCQDNKSMAQAYTAGLWDLSARAVLLLDSTKSGTKDHWATDYALDRLGRFCEPEHVILEQVTDVFCAFLRDVPERRQDPAPFLFSKAMTKAWPCKKP